MKYLLYILLLVPFTFLGQTDPIYGCIIPFASNYDASANTEDGSCEFDGLRFNTEVCIDPIAENYFPYLDPASPFYNESLLSNFDVNNEVCTYAYGCTDPTAINYDSEANTDDGSCIAAIVGCMDEGYFEFDENANVSN